MCCSLQTYILIQQSQWEHLNKRPEEFKKGYENIITYAVPLVFWDFLPVDNKLWKHKTMSLVTKTFLLLSIRGVQTEHAVDADLELLLIDSEKNILMWFQIIQNTQVNTFGFLFFFLIIFSCSEFPTVDWKALKIQKFHRENTCGYWVRWKNWIL